MEKINFPWQCNQQLTSHPSVSRTGAKSKYFNLLRKNHLRNKVIYTAFRGSLLLGSMIYCGDDFWPIYGEGEKMEDGIQVVIGVADERHGSPMQFVQFDGGVRFTDEYTTTDLTICVAVLRDLADAIDIKIKMMTH